MNKIEKMNMIWDNCFKEVITIIKKDAEHESTHSSNFIFDFSDNNELNYQYLLRMIKLYSEQQFDIAFIKILELHGIKRKYIPFLFKDESCMIHIILLSIRNKVYAFSFSGVNYPNSIELEEYLLKLNIDTIHFITLTNKAIVNRNAMVDSFKYITIFDFFEKFVSSHAKDAFLNNLNKFSDQIKKIIGYKTIKTLDYSSRKYFITTLKLLFEKDKIYNYKFKILDSRNFDKIDNEKDKMEYLKCDNFQLDKNLSEKLEKYFNENYGTSVVASNTDFAKSILTAEWLYYSLKDKRNYDYTSIIVGYCKALEQFLSMIIGFYKNKNDIMFISYKKNNYENKRFFKNELIDFKVINNDLYINYRVENDEYYKNSLFSYIEVLCEQILQKYRNANITNNQVEKLKKMLHCFRIESRNEYLHTENLDNIKIVENTRTNFYILVFLIISYLKNNEIKKYNIGAVEDDKFNCLKNKLERLRRQNNLFKLTSNQSEINEVVYHFTLNSDNFNENGVEHYDSFYFVKISGNNALSLPFEPINAIKDSIIKFTRESNYVSLKWIDVDGSEMELL